MNIASYDTSRKGTIHNGTSAQWKRVTQHTPCECCGAKKHCEYTADGVIHCMHEDAARARGGRPYNYRGGGFLITPRAVRLLPSQGELPPIAPATDSEPAHDVETADADTKHAVYSSLLELCPLMKAHGELLTGDGHSLTVDQARRYGTLPRDARKVCAELEQRHGRATVLSVPGFIEKDGRLEARGAGIILPTRHTCGRIVAIDVRRERTEPGQAKYFKLSCGSIGGPNAGTPAHVAQPSTLRDMRTVYITEGVKKSDVAADALGCVVIGLAGHTTWRHALTALGELAEGGATECIIALDRDSNPKTIAEVDRSRQQLAAAAVELGYAVRLAVWDAAAAKGLDDLLQAGLTPMRERYRPVLASGEEHAQLKAQYETARSRESDLTRVLTMPHMKPTDKVLTCAAYITTNQFPSLCGDEPPPLVQSSREYLAGQAGVSTSTVTTGLPGLADLGLIRREVRYDPQTRQGELWIGGGRLPDAPFAKEQVQSPARAKDRARKMCPHCGSTHLAVHSYECEDCNAICTAEQADAAGEAAVEAAALTAAEEVQTATDAQGRVIDMETGEILHSAPPPSPQSDDTREWDDDAAERLIAETLNTIANSYDAEGGLLPGDAAIQERIDTACAAHDMEGLTRQCNALLALYGIRTQQPRRCPCGRMEQTDCAGECPFNGVSEVLS